MFVGKPAGFLQTRRGVLVPNPLRKRNRLTGITTPQASENAGFLDINFRAAVFTANALPAHSAHG